jgi:hypothetical protein
MTNLPDVDQIFTETRRYEFTDGLRDIQMAILLGIIGAVTWLVLQPLWMNLLKDWGQKYGRGSAWLGLLVVFVPALAAWGILALMKLIRNRWLWRESGMVKPARWVVPRRVTVLSVVILVAGVVLATLARHQGWVEDIDVLRTLWATIGWSFGYTLIGMGRELGLPRYIWLGAIGSALSTALIFLQLTFAQVALAFGLCWGLLLTVSGLITLRLSVRALKGAE